MGVIIGYIGSYLAGAATSALAYFIKRWWEGTPEKERIDEIAKLLSLHKDLKGKPGDLNELTKFKAELLSGSVERIRNEKEVIDEIGSALTSQLEMNFHAANQQELAQLELTNLANLLRTKLSDAELEALQRAQDTWEIYADAQAKFASMIVEGGSMQPLMYHSELRDLAVQQAAKIKQEIKQRSDLLAKD